MSFLRCALVAFLGLVALSQHPPALAQVSPGEILLSEMNCTACHEAAPEIAARLRSRASPRLGKAGLSLPAAWIQQFLTAPHTYQPGTLMPDLLHRLPPEEKEQAAEALTHFLVSLQPPPPAPRKPRNPGDVALGDALYHAVGCVACHAPQHLPEGLEDPNAAAQLALAQNSAAPLKHLPEKYTPETLSAFLESPLAVRPSGRMPSSNLTSDEAKAISAFLLRDQVSSPGPSFQVDPGKAARGAELFGQLNCGSCHPGVAEARRARPLASLRARQPSGCLAPNPGPTVPRFELTDRQRVVLLAALGNQEALSVPLTPAQTVKRTMTTLNCYACHSRDRRGGLSVFVRRYFEGAPAPAGPATERRLPPSLAQVGGRRSTQEITEILLHGSPAQSPPRVRMPRFGRDNIGHLPEAFTKADNPQLSQ